MRGCYHFSGNTQGQRKKYHVQKKHQRNRCSIPAELRHHWFEHNAEGKSGAGLEKKQEKTGGQNVPAIEDTKAQRRQHRYHSLVSLRDTVLQLECICATASRAISR